VNEELKFNDVILPKDEGFGLNHFVIRYCPEKNNYILKIWAMELELLSKFNSKLF